MEKPGPETSIPGCRQSDLKKSFKFALRSLLTACSKQDFLEIFSKFSKVEQEKLYKLYTEIIVSLHRQLQEKFETLCHISQIGPILDRVEEMVEEQNLDPLFSDKTNVMDIANDLTTAKKNEIQRLTSLLQKAEEQNRQMESRISLLKQQTQDVSGTAEAIAKLKSVISGYFEGNDKLPPI